MTAPTPSLLLLSGVDRGAVRHPHNRRKPSWGTDGRLLGRYGKRGARCLPYIPYTHNVAHWPVEQELDVWGDAWLWV